MHGCRLLGPSGAGLTIAGTSPYRIIISENIFFKAQDGIRFEGGAQWRDDSVLNNTFYECRNGIVFTQMPADGARGLSFRRNLFAKISGTEGVVQSGFDPGRFADA